MVCGKFRACTAIWPPGDPQALAELILQELPRLPGLPAICRPDPSILAQMQTRFSLPGMVADTAEVYARLLKRRLPSIAWPTSPREAQAAA